MIYERQAKEDSQISGRQMRCAATMLYVLGRIVPVVILAVVNSSCTNSGSENAQLSAARAVQYESAGLLKLEPNAIAAADAAVLRQAHRLVLHLRSGADKTYEDSESCYQNDPKTVATCHAFVLISYVKTRGIFLILKGYYEGADFLLVDDATGDETLINAFPLFSPSGNRVLVLMNGGMDNSVGIEIWRRTDHRFEREWADDPVGASGATPLNYRLDDWKNETELDLSATVSPSGKLSCVRKIHLSLLDGHWKATVGDVP